jgi:hypothetical protein
MVLLWIYFVGGLIAVHTHAVLRRDRRLLIAAASLDTAALLFLVTALVHPVRFESWMQEDGWVEWATFYSFAAAAAVSSVALRRSFGRPDVAPIPRLASGSRWLYRMGLLGLAAFCAFVALEEISWGQRIFGFEPPEMFLAENFQQELNLHNMLKGKELAGVDLESRTLVAIIALGYGVVLAGVGELARRTRRLDHPLLRVLPPIALSPWFAGVALVEIAYPISLAGEACELVLGLLFAVDAVWRDGGSLSDSIGARARRWRITACAAAAVLALSLATGPLLERLVFGTDQERSTVARAEVAALRRDIAAAGTVRSRLLRKNVHKRLFTAVRSGYLDLAGGEFLGGRATPADPRADSPRQDRLGYFLDPWNNAYWIHYRKRTRQVTVYSFGPNRRRDSELDGRQPLGGDDIGVVFELPTAPPAANAKLR